MSANASLTAFLGRVDKAQKGITHAQAEGANAVAFAMKTSITGLMAEASGGDLRLSGVGKKGARIGARYKAATAGYNAAALLHAYGPAHFVERDTSPHGLGARGDEVTLMVLPDGGVRTGPWVGGGSQGKHPFAKGVTAIEPIAPRIFQQAVRKHALSHFKG